MIKISLILETDQQGAVSARADNESNAITPTELEVLRQELQRGFKGYEHLVKTLCESLINKTKSK